MHEIREQRAEASGINNIFEMLRETQLRCLLFAELIGESMNENVTNVQLANVRCLHRNLSEWKTRRGNSGISRRLVRNENSLLLFHLCNYRRHY